MKCVFAVPVSLAGEYSAISHANDVWHIQETAMSSDPFFLEDPFLSTGEVSRVSGAPMGALKGWIRPDRGIVVPGHCPAVPATGVVKLTGAFCDWARIWQGARHQAKSAPHCSMAAERFRL
jgi:hypothetical protein